MIQLGDNIRKFRELKGLSQQKVADEIKEKRSTYAEWERGIEPKASALVKIAKVLGVSMSDLLEGIDDKPSKTAYNGHEKQTGYVPAEDMIAVLKEQNDFLRRNFETSLESIVEGQQQTGIQLKALSWFSALAAAGGDEKKAQESMLAIGNRIAAYEGIVGGEGNSEKVDTRNTGGGRQQKRK